MKTQMMSRLILIRPGCTDFDEQQRIQGTLDLPLSDRGEDQQRQLLSDLADTEIDLIFTSPTEPALTTAEQLAEMHRVECRVVPQLSNVDQGLWQGLQLEELRRKQPRVYKQLQEDPCCVCPPEGESLTDALARVREGLERPLKKKGRLIIVAPDPVACLIEAIVNKTPVTDISPACSGRCGTWVPLNEVDEVTSAVELPTISAAALKPA
jgi:broad specificity phosphatase PhoE